MIASCLASGSSGNVLLVSAGGVRILVDCGLGARRLTDELRELGVHPSTLNAVFLSHEHSDHVRSVSTLSRRYGIPVLANHGTLEALGHMAPRLAESMTTGSTVTIDSLSVTSFPLPHDGRETVGYFLQAGGRSVCIATDLGEVPPHLIEYLRAADLMILEANHDVEQLIDGPYPWLLKRRVLGRNGHLSNVDSAAAVTLAVSGDPQTLWLAHLSEVNNSPTLALETVRERIEQEGICSVQVAVALRDRRSLVWDSGAGLPG